MPAGSLDIRLLPEANPVIGEAIVSLSLNVNSLWNGFGHAIAVGRSVDLLDSGLDAVHVIIPKTWIEQSDVSVMSPWMN